jgi:hypothetical protein
MWRNWSNQLAMRRHMAVKHKTIDLFIVENEKIPTAKQAFTKKETRPAR